MRIFTHDRVGERNEEISAQSSCQRLCGYFAMHGWVEGMRRSLHKPTVQKPLYKQVSSENEEYSARLPCGYLPMIGLENGMRKYLHSRVANDCVDISPCTGGWRE